MQDAGAADIDGIDIAASKMARRRIAAKVREPVLSLVGVGHEIDAGVVRRVDPHLAGIDAVALKQGDEGATEFVRRRPA